jgi:hypothetical protein
MEPFFLIPELISLPTELLELGMNGKAYISSSPKGWTTRDAFTIWVIHFINFISSYRWKLPRSLRGEKILLILDGHSSRANPFALTLLRISNIRVLIIPSHTSHIIQMFDVGLASSFKHHYVECPPSLKRRVTISFPSEAAKQRYFMLRAAITAWALASSPENCRGSGSASGHFPFDPEKILSGRWVFELSAEFHQKFAKCTRRSPRSILSINEKVLTDVGVILEIVESMKANASLRHLIEFPIGAKYSEIIKKMLSNPQGNVFLLTLMPPFFPLNGFGPIPFD